MLSTKNIKMESGGGSSAKTLTAGNVTAKINSVTLEDFEMKEGAKYLTLHLEGMPEGDDFEGFYIDKDRPELGRHTGKVARVRHHQYAYVDTQTKMGMIYRDDEILRALKHICIATDCESWLVSQDEKHANIDSLVEQFSADAPFKDKWIDFCLAGREYMNKSGYTDYSLYLPKFAKKMVPYEKHGLESGNLIQYDEATHLKKMEAKPVDSFGEETEVAPEPAKKGKKTVLKDFEL